MRLWSKFEQTIIWTVTYIPLILIMILRFVIGNDFIDLKFNRLILEGGLLILILVISYLFFKITIKYFLSGYEKELKVGGKGKNYYIRKINYLSVNDYSFFLLTLLLPLISIDHSSLINLLVSILIIICVIFIYVKTDAISVCPLFLFSGRRVYKGIISSGDKCSEAENPSLRKEAIIILMEQNLNLNGKMRGEELAGNVYYLTSIKRDH